MRALSLGAALLVLGGCASIASTGSAPDRSSATVVGESEDFIVAVPVRNELRPSVPEKLYPHTRARPAA